MLLSKTLKTGLIGLLIISVSSLFSQTDVTSWTAVQLNYKANSKLTLSVKPIQRQNEDLAGYDNTSIDIFANYKLGKGWSIGVLDRHFFIPDSPDRIFTFFDIKNSYKTGKIQLNNLFRYHLGRFEVRDFVRYYPSVAWTNDSKLTPFIGIDFFMDNSLSELAGARYTAGTKYKLGANSGINLIYWRQKGYSDRPIANHHNIYLTYVYNIANGMKKTSTPTSN